MHFANIHNIYYYIYPHYILQINAQYGPSMHPSYILPSSTTHNYYIYIHCIFHNEYTTYSVNTCIIYFANIHNTYLLHISTAYFTNKYTIYSVNTSIIYFADIHNIYLLYISILYLANEYTIHSSTHQSYILPIYTMHIYCI